MSGTGCFIGVVVAFSALGCGRTKVQDAFDSGGVGVADSAADRAPDREASDSNPLGDGGADADGLACFVPTFRAPGLVCFGDDPAPYLMYLEPRDGGPVVGVCPAPNDFDQHYSEGDVGYLPCGGPLTAEQIAIARDAGAPMTDAGGIVCCYWVEERFGV